MKKILLLLFLITLSAFAVNYARQVVSDQHIVSKSSRYTSENTKAEFQLQEGDVIFQSSVAGQGRVIQIATGSVYSHCGIIYKEGEQFYVFEAIQPVQRTRFREFISRGDNSRYVIKRLKNADAVLSPLVLQKMKNEGEKMAGKKYDLTFEWSDERIYCSELVWKIYQRGAGIEIASLSKLKDFNLSHELVKEKLKERYGDAVPLEEKVISPGAIFESALLTTVFQN